MPAVLPDSSSPMHIAEQAKRRGSLSGAGQRTPHPGGGDRRLARGPTAGLREGTLIGSAAGGQARRRPSVRGCSTVVVRQPSKLFTRVRFPSPAPPHHSPIRLQRQPYVFNSAQAAQNALWIVAVCRYT